MKIGEVISSFRSVSLRKHVQRHGDAKSLSRALFVLLAANVLYLVAGITVDLLELYVVWSPLSARLVLVDLGFLSMQCIPMILAARAASTQSHVRRGLYLLIGLTAFVPFLCNSVVIPLLEVKLGWTYDLTYPLDDIGRISQSAQFLILLLLSKLILESHPTLATRRIVAGCLLTWGASYALGTFLQIGPHIRVIDWIDAYDLPDVCAMLLMFICPLPILFFAGRSLGVSITHLCVRCGYDVSHASAERCPECGHVLGGNAASDPPLWPS